MEQLSKNHLSFHLHFSFFLKRIYIFLSRSAWGPSEMDYRPGMRPRQRSKLSSFKQESLPCLLLVVRSQWHGGWESTSGPTSVCWAPSWCQGSLSQKGRRPWGPKINKYQWNPIGFGIITLLLGNRHLHFCTMDSLTSRGPACFLGLPFDG